MEKNKIKEEYFDKAAFDFTIEKYKKFVNNVWRRFLTIDGYYLLMPVSPLTNMDNLEKILNQKSHYFRVISKEALKNTPTGEIGFIVTIDWLDMDKLYMPEEFMELNRIEANPNIQGVYSINQGEGIVSSAYASAKAIAECLDIPFQSFDKTKYDGFYEIDYDAIVSEVITSYLLRTSKVDIDLRDKLFQKYYNDIAAAYKILKEENQYTDEGFLNKAIEYINEHENIKGENL